MEQQTTNLQFRILINGERLDSFIYERYSDAKIRLQKLSNIFKYFSFHIVVI